MTQYEWKVKNDIRPLSNKICSTKWTIKYKISKNESQANYSQSGIHVLGQLDHPIQFVLVDAKHAIYIVSIDKHFAGKMTVQNPDILCDTICGLSVEVDHTRCRGFRTW